MKNKEWISPYDLYVIKKQTMKSKPNKFMYCSNCGEELNETLVGAENYYRVTIGGAIYYPYKAFDSKDGKRQYVCHYKCLNKKWWNHCDSYSVAEIIKL